MPHDHDHDHEEGSALSPIALRVKALESLLVEKGYVDPQALDVIVETYETKIGPRNGAHVVAKAWSDPEYKAWLLKDATAAIASLGYTGRQGEHMVAVMTQVVVSEDDLASVVAPHVIQAAVEDELVVVRGRRCMLTTAGIARHDELMAAGAPAVSVKRNSRPL